MSKYIQIADNLFHYIQTNQKRIKVFYLQNTMSCNIIRQENSPEYLAIQGSYSKTVLAFDLSDGDAYATIPRCSIDRSIHKCCVSPCYNCPASTCSTIRSTSRSAPLGS